jgi:nucleoredoxin
MKIKLLLTACVLLPTLALLHVFAEQNLQTWKDIYGREFEAEIVSVQPSTVRLRNADGKEIDFAINQLKPESQTQARNWKAPGKAGALSEFTNEFKDDLVILKDNKVVSLKDPDLGNVKYYAFYKSASWCGPCRKFTPELVKFYNRIKPDHPEFELIMISHDRSEKAMEAYMKSDNMPWPAFEQGKHADAVKSYGTGIPCLIVTDASGKKLFDSYTEKGQYMGPSSVMREIEKLLK